MRPGHPAQRRAAQGGREPKPGIDAARTAGADPAGRAGRGEPSGPNPGDPGTAEVVAGRNAVLEALRAAVPAIALHVGPRLDPDERIGEAVMLAADAGIPVVEAGRAELDRMTGGAMHQGLALRVRPYRYAHPDDLIAGRRGRARR